MSQPPNRNVAVTLALMGLIVPGLHKFYLGQFRWGVLYLLVGFTPLGAIARIASLTDAALYLMRGQPLQSAGSPAGASVQPASTASPTVSTGLLSGLFKAQPAPEPFNPQQVGAIAEAIRHLEQLRQDGLISEYEFEQKRRQLLEQMS